MFVVADLFTLESEQRHSQTAAAVHSQTAAAEAAAAAAEAAAAAAAFELNHCDNPREVYS